MKGLEKIIMIAVFVVPIVICVFILKNIWSDDTEFLPTGDGDTDTNEITVTIDPPVVEPPDTSIFSGDTTVNVVDGNNNSGESAGRPEQISKLYTDAEIKSVLADVYSATDVTSERIGTMEKYTKVTAQKYSGGWSQVTGIDSKGINISGWVKTDNISFPEDGELNVRPSKGTGVVTAEPYLNVRLNPSTTAEIIAKINKGETVVIEESTNGWHKVTVDGRTGWVSSDFIK